MNKEELLNAVAGGLKNGSITLPELLSQIKAFETKTEDVHSEKVSRGFNLARLLYYIGGGIVVIGLAIFVGQQWDELSSALRILLTLGVGIGFFVSAVTLDSAGLLDRVPGAFHFIAGVLIPGGIIVTLDELGVHGNGWGLALIFAVLSLLYVLASRFFPGAMLIAFAILYGTTGLLLLTDVMGREGSVEQWGKFTAYRLLGVGLSYLAFALAFQANFLRVLSPWLYGVGTLFFLGSGLYLGGWKPEQSVLWELSFPIIVLVTMYGATIVKSRAMLFFGAIFLAGFIFKITGEYFSDSLGWPLMLVLAGFTLIGVGYLAYFLNRKYLKVTEFPG